MSDTVRPDPTASLLPHDPSLSPPTPHTVLVYRAVVGLYPQGGALPGLETLAVPVESVERWREDAIWKPQGTHGALYATSHEAAQAAVSGRIVHELLPPGVPTRAEALAEAVRATRIAIREHNDGREAEGLDLSGVLPPDPRLVLPL